MPDRHDQLRETVEQAGFFTTSMPLPDGGSRLVCAAQRHEHGLSGASFWIAERHHRWYVGTWGGLLYRLPGARVPTDFVVKWLTCAGESTQSDVPHYLKQEFSLMPVDDGEVAHIPVVAPGGDYKAAHVHSSIHRDEIEASDLCGCFHCLQTFPPSQIREWTDEPHPPGVTALCPRCGVDAVIGSASGFPMTADFLKGMHHYWFVR